MNTIKKQAELAITFVRDNKFSELECEQWTHCSLVRVGKAAQVRVGKRKQDVRVRYSDPIASKPSSPKQEHTCVTEPEAQSRVPVRVP